MSLFTQATAGIAKVLSKLGVKGVTVSPGKPNHLIATDSSGQLDSAFLGSLASSGLAGVYYIASNGNDTWSGHPDKPLKTIQAAIDKAQTAGLSSAALVIAPGTYGSATITDANLTTLVFQGISSEVDTVIQNINLNSAASNIRLDVYTLSLNTIQVQNSGIRLYCNLAYNAVANQVIGSSSNPGDLYKYPGSSVTTVTNMTEHQAYNTSDLWYDPTVDTDWPSIPVPGTDLQTTLDKAGSRIRKLETGNIPVNELQLGDGTDSNITITAKNADTNKPKIRYNKTDNRWEYTNDGSTWKPMQSASDAPVQSVAGKTGDVDLDLDDVADSANRKAVSQSDKDKLDNITVNNSVNLDDLKTQADANTSNIATNATNISQNANNISTNATNIADNSNRISDITDSGKIKNNAIYVGDGDDDVDITFYADNTDTNKPFIRYNASTNTWIVSHDGVNTKELGVQGEANTGANIGVSGSGIYAGKSGVTLQFKNINVASNKLSITESSNVIFIDVQPQNIKLDSLHEPDDTVTLDVTTARHGLCPKLPGDPAKFLSGAGDYRIPNRVENPTNGDILITDGEGKPVDSGKKFNDSGTTTNDVWTASQCKAYTDNQIAAMYNSFAFKDEVECATTGNIVLFGEQTIDGVTTNNSRVLVKDQNDKKENGIYISGPGDWVRATDMDDPADFNAAAVPILDGTSNKGTMWKCTSINPVIGVDNIEFVNWETETPDATTTVKGKVELAEQSEAEARTDTVRALTPSSVQNFVLGRTDGTATTENNVPQWDNENNKLKNGKPIGTGANHLVERSQANALDADKIKEVTADNGVLVDDVKIKDGVVYVDLVAEKQTDQGVLVDDIVVKDREVSLDKLSERTADNGIEADEVKFKDGEVSARKINELDTDTGVEIDEAKIKDGKGYFDEVSELNAGQGIGLAEVKKILLQNAASKTISAGAISVAQTFVSVLGEGGLDDYLDTINGGSLVNVIVLFPGNSSQKITIRNNIGNIITPNGNNFELPDNGVALLVWDGTYWRLIANTGDKQQGYYSSFTDSDLSASHVLTVNHGLEQKTGLSVSIWDNNDNIITPDSTHAVDNNNLEIDLSSFAPLTGTWHVGVIRTTTVDSKLYENEAFETAAMLY